MPHASTTHHPPRPTSPLRSHMLSIPALFTAPDPGASHASSEQVARLRRCPPSRPRCPPAISAMTKATRQRSSAQLPATLTTTAAPFPSARSPLAAFPVAHPRPKTYLVQPPSTSSPSPLHLTRPSHLPHVAVHPMPHASRVLAALSPGQHSICATTCTST